MLPKILLTNDDGVDAPGVKLIADRLTNFGHVVCVCPDKQNSGQSMAITMLNPLSVTQLVNSDKLDVYKVDGTPVDCINLGVSQLVGQKPDLIVSGINLGSNASANMLFSGTMGAVFEGCLLGIPSIGFSLDSYNPDASYDNCLPFVDIIVERVLKHGLPEGVCLNVNIPACDEKPKAMRLTTLCRGKWEAVYTLAADVNGVKQYRAGGKFLNAEPENDRTDLWNLKNGFVSVTPVVLDRTYRQWEDLNWLVQ